MVALGEIAELGSGGTPKRSVPEYFGPGTPWLSIADLNDGVVYDAKESLTDSGLANSSAKVVPPGTLLVAMYGSIGKLAIAGIELCTSQAIALVRPKDDVVDRQYLFHYLMEQRPRLQALGRGGTQMNIGQGDLKKWSVPLPPLDEQRRIAAILDHADALRATRRQVIADLSNLRESIFLEAFGDPIANPCRHPVHPLEQWVDASRPVTYGILKPGPDIDGGVPYVRVADMRSGRIDVSGVRRTSLQIAKEYRRSRLVAGDLLISIRGHVGRFAFVPEELAGGNITQDSARLAVSDPADAIYVRAALETPSFQHWMVRHTKGAAVRGINLGDLRKAPIPRPPISDRIQFASAVHRLATQQRSTDAQLSVANALFSSLQSRAFRGELC